MHGGRGRRLDMVVMQVASLRRAWPGCLVCCGLLGLVIGRAGSAHTGARSAEVLVATAPRGRDCAHAMVLDGGCLLLDPSRLVATAVQVELRLIP